MVEIEIVRVDVCTLDLFSFDVEARHFGEEGSGGGRRGGVAQPEASPGPRSSPGEH